MRKNKYDVNKQIAIYIISAQIASDAGKQIFEININTIVGRQALPLLKGAMYK
jgi:hypothetical protein